LGSIERGDDLLRARDDLPLDSPLLELNGRETEQLRCNQEGRVIIIHYSVIPHLCYLDVAKVEKSCEESEDGPLLFDANADSRQSALSRAELLRIINSDDCCGIQTALIEVEELGDIIESKILLLFRRCPSAQLIENVIIPFALGLVHQPRTLKEICSYPRSHDFVFAIEENLGDAWAGVECGIQTQNSPVDTCRNEKNYHSERSSRYQTPLE